MRRMSRGSRMAMRVKTKQNGLTARRSTPTTGARVCCFTVERVAPGGGSEAVVECNGLLAKGQGHLLSRSTGRDNRLPATKQEIGREQNSAKDGDRQSARGEERYAGQAKHQSLDERPHGECGRGIEISGDVPVAALEVADRGIAVPALVRVFGPVHPGGMVWKISREMDEVQCEESCRCKKQDSFNKAKTLVRDARVGRRGGQSSFIVIRRSSRHYDTVSMVVQQSGF